METREAEQRATSPVARPTTSLTGTEDRSLDNGGDASDPVAETAPAPGVATEVVDAEVEVPVTDGPESAAPPEDEVGEGGYGMNELPELPSLPDNDLDFDDEPSHPPASADANNDIDLAPLPTDFDPDAPLPDLPPTSVPEDDELAIVPREEPEPPPTSEPELQHEQPEELEQSESQPVEEDPNENTEQDPALFDLIRGLVGGEGGAGADTEGNEEQALPVLTDEAMDVDAVADDNEQQGSPTLTSPLTPLAPMSPIPELPAELDLDGDIDIAPLPPPSYPPELGTYPAESSASALRRERDLSSSASPAPDELSLSGRRRRSPPEHDPDDLEEGRPRERYKRRKDINGKPIRTSQRSRKRLDKQLGVVRDGNKPPEKVAPRARTLSTMRLKAMVRGRTRETQLAPCIRPRYAPWGKCTQCVSKIGGDSCRFRNYRTFPLNPETGDITGPGWFESTTLDEPMTRVRDDKFNRPLSEEHITRTEKTVAPLLVGLISREMRHVIKNNAIHRPIDTTEHRSVCDFCSSTIFAGFWFCTKCGRDFCIECERFFSDSADTLTTSPWPVPDSTRPRLHRCTRGDDPLPIVGRQPRAGKLKQVMHFRKDLKAASRLSADELRSDFLALINFVLEPGASDMDLEARIASLDLDADETELESSVRSFLETSSPSAPPRESPWSEAEIQALYDASKNLAHVPDPTEIKSHPFMFVDGDRLDTTPGAFDALWARGEPIVVDNLLKRLNEKYWTPDYFIRKFQGEQCYVVDCQNESKQLTSVGAFFLLFNETGGERPRPSVTLNTPSTTGPAASDSPGLPGASQSTQPNPHSPAIHHHHHHQFSVIDERARASPHEPMAVDGNETSATPAATSASAPSNSTGATPSTNGHHAAASDDSISKTPTPAPAPTLHFSQPPSTASFNSRPIAPAPAGPLGSTVRRQPTFEERVAQYSAWAPGYGKLKSQKRIFKLKDWPSTDDFATAYPDLYDDFTKALPAPDYTQRIGVLNLYSHFPPGPTRPDIGPKMYNALAAREDPGGFGSTRLHMDVADAVNIMLYASKRADGSPGCAVWDLFRAEDADKIREFLREKFPHERMTDPIHSQKFYLDSKLRTELYNTKGVASFRVYQYPGQAVFVPAGCAHQVCNLANCMKIALDFVSPHNVRRCQQLMHDFRRENYAIIWKEDVLQLYNVMWHAWTNVRSIREGRKREELRQARAREWFRRHGGHPPPLPLYSHLHPGRGHSGPQPPRNDPRYTTPYYAGRHDDSHNRPPPHFQHMQSNQAYSNPIVEQRHWNLSATSFVRDDPARHPFPSTATSSAHDSAARQPPPRPTAQSNVRQDARPTPPPVAPTPPPAAAPVQPSSAPSATPIENADVSDSIAEPSRNPPATASVPPGSREDTPQHATPTSSENALPTPLAHPAPPSGATSPRSNAVPAPGDTPVQSAPAAATSTTSPSAPVDVPSVAARGGADNDKVASADITLSTAPPANERAEKSTQDLPSNDTSAPHASQEQERTADKNPESASDSLAANGVAVPTSQIPAQSRPTSRSPPPAPAPLSPRRMLAQRLLEAALERVPKPEEHIEPAPKQVETNYYDGFSVDALPQHLEHMDELQGSMAGFDDFGMLG